MSLRASFRDAPVKRKLMLLGLMTSGLALFYISLFMMVADWVSVRTRMVSDLTTYAKVIGTNAASAVLFDDRKAAAETLFALAAIPDIVYASINDESGVLFATYLAPGHSSHSPGTMQHPKSGHYLLTLDRLVVAQPIALKGDLLGMVYLEADMQGVYAIILRDVGLIAAAALAAFLMTLLLFSRLQKAIVHPIHDLADAIQAISVEQNYGVRATVYSQDEIGMLSRAFNGMLDRLQERDAELAQHREHLEQEVAQRTAKLTEAQRIAHLGNWEWNVANNKLDWSDEIYRIFGLTPQQFGATYEAFLQAVHPEDRQSVDVHVREALEQGCPYSIDHRILLPDGSLRHVHEQAEVSRSENGQAIKMVGTVQDITEHKLAEEAIRKQQELTAQIIETIPMRVFWKGRDLRYLGGNTLFAKDAGLIRPNELIGKTDFDMGWKDQAELYRDDDRRVMDSNTPKLFYDEPQTTPEGGQIWLRSSKVPLHNEVNAVMGVLGVYEDITSYKQMELRLLESEERFRKAFQYAAVGMALVGLDGRWLKVNDSLCQIVGYSEQELLGKTFQDITHPDDLQSDLDLVAQLLAGEVDHYQMEKRYFHKDGHDVWIRLSVSLIRDAQGKPVHFVSQIDDITEDKLAEEKIRKLNEELDEKVKERTRQLMETQEELVRKEKLAVLGQVAGSVGHELRNPLGVMNNAVYFLQTVLSDADDTTKEYLNIIKDEIAGSERIVSDLLDAVRTKPPHPEAVSIAELIGQTLRKCTVPASVTVKLDIPATLPALRVDAMQIHQVFRNLISNGVEAMPGGGPLEISAVEDAPARTVAISVRDSGTGIAPEVLAKLFQPLFTTKARGIGLGLVVVKNLTEANGGTVKVESEAGKGTQFTVTLPVADERDILK